MELKYEIALYVCLGIAMIMVVFSFVRFRRRKKYKKGTKAFEADYLKEIPYFRRKMVLYKFLKVLLTMIIIASIAISGFLMARPYNTEVDEIRNMNRVIILCMDI